VEGVETLPHTVQSSEDWQKVKQLAEKIRLVEATVSQKGCEHNRLRMARIAERMKREEERMERASTAEDGDAEVVDRMVQPTAFVSDEEAAADSFYLEDPDEDPDADEMATALSRIGRGHIMMAEAQEEIARGYLEMANAMHRAGY
jgi:hypothetical protein